MSRYLSFAGKMLKADWSRPGRYLSVVGHEPPPTPPEELEHLIYLTYFKKNFMGTSYDEDDPVLCPEGFNKITTSNKHTNTYTRTFTNSLEPGMSTEFIGNDYGEFRTNPAGGDAYFVKDLQEFDWELPYKVKDDFTLTMKVYFNTQGYVAADYHAGMGTDIDYYHFLPMIMPLFGDFNFYNPEDGHTYTSLKALGKFYSEGYPRQCLVGGTATDESDVYSVNPPWKLYQDPTYNEYSPYPPAGRRFLSQYNNSTSVNRVNGDQWYDLAVVHKCLPDALWEYYAVFVNGIKVYSIKRNITSSQFEDQPWLGNQIILNFRAKDYTTNDVKVVVQGIAAITELALWDTDISTNPLGYGTIKTSSVPMYKKNEQGIYVYNENFHWDS